MIPRMTEPDMTQLDNELEDYVRRTATITLAGLQLEIKELVDVQLMHLARYARILMRDGVPRGQKFEAMEQMLNILHKCVVDPQQLQELLDLEYAGEVTMKDMLVFGRHFVDQDRQAAATAPPAVAKRRGRPRKSVS